MTRSADRRWRELVREIQESPDDDAPRLVAADWLIECGDPRGEHVMLQVTLARLAAGAPQRAAIESRLAEIRPAWLKPLHALGAEGVSWARETMPLRLVRGFVDEAQLTGRAVGDAGVLLCVEPITELSLVSGGPAANAQTAATPELERLHGLHLGGRHLQGQDVVIRSPFLGGLRVLTITRSPKTIWALPDCVARPHRLFAMIDDDCAAAIAKASLLDRIRWLTIGNHELGDRGVIAIAEHPLEQLERLDLSDAQVGARGLRALGTRLGQLASLDLSRCTLTSDMVDALIEHATGRLRVLELSSVDERDAVDALLDSPVAASVEELDLRGAAFSPPALRGLLARGRVHRATPDLDLDQIDWSANNAIAAAFPRLSLTTDDAR